MRTWVLVVTMAAAPALADEKDKASEKAKDPTEATLQGRMLNAEKISARVRELLKRKMKHHTKDLGQLTRAIVLGEHANVDRLAQGIINEPKLDKATAGDDLSGLSDVFFQLQDQLRERAGEVQKAAAAKDLHGMTGGLGNLTTTCASCHAVFREPAGAAPKK